MRYKINGRITQSGRRTIEQGLYRWLQSRGASNIKINSVLDTSSRSGTGLVASASVLQLSDVLADNSTAVDTTAAEEQPLSATELAAGAAALDAAIAEDEAQPRDEPLGTGVTIASTRRSTRRYCSAVSAAGGGAGMGRAQEGFVGVCAVGVDRSRGDGVSVSAEAQASGSHCCQHKALLLSCDCCWEKGAVQCICRVW